MSLGHIVCGHFLIVSWGPIVARLRLFSIKANKLAWCAAVFLAENAQAGRSPSLRSLPCGVLLEYVLQLLTHQPATSSNGAFGWLPGGQFLFIFK